MSNAAVSSETVRFVKASQGVFFFFVAYCCATRVLILVSIKETLLDVYIKVN
mgnify:CR=1 FL=1